VSGSFKISVIIPVYNRLDVLLRTLVHLSRQTLPNELFEVIVVDDGSSEPIKEKATGLDLPYKMSVICQDHRGPAAARNLGAANGSGEVLLFLDADMLAEGNLLEAHLQAQEYHKQALIEGLRKIYLSERTPFFMQIIDVDTNPKNKLIDFPEMLTCNLSVKRSNFQKLGGFEENLLKWEDVEFGYRAKQAGCKLVFLPEAVAYHEHPMSFHEFCEKQKILYEQAWRFFKLHLEALGSFEYLSDKLPVDHQKDPLKMITRKNIRSLLALPPVLFGMQQIILVLERNKRPKNLLKFLYWKVIGSYQLTGLREGYKTTY
jgi:GT2 family glycosyltransferase